MATTSPDNIWSPDSDDQYTPTVDLAAMADSVQDAITSNVNTLQSQINTKANSYVGPGWARLALPNPPQGTLWQDTDGERKLWVREGSTWVWSQFFTNSNPSNNRVYFGTGRNATDFGSTYIGMSPTSQTEFDLTWWVQSPDPDPDHKLAVKNNGDVEYRHGLGRVDDTDWEPIPLESGIVPYNGMPPLMRRYRGRLITQGAFTRVSGSFERSYVDVFAPGAFPDLPGVRDSFRSVRLLPSAGSQTPGRFFILSNGSARVATTESANYFIMNAEWFYEAE